MKRISEVSGLLANRWPNTRASNRDLLEYVKPIVRDVEKRGDQAIREYTERFDKVKLGAFRITPREIQASYENVSQSKVEALRESRSRLEKVESLRLAQNCFTVEVEGTIINLTLKPLRSVGCYVPGGKAAYPSTVVMNVVPAKVAGVERVVVCTPPRKDGSVDPLTLVACDVCMVDEVYAVGGIQAIAAMAYGTKTLTRIDKIVGPGNRYVTAAKIVVSDHVLVDKPAGPSEILIIADEVADPVLIAVDLISQSEHGSDGISGLVTTSEKIADKVTKLIEELVSDCERSEIVSEVLSEGGFIYTVPNIEKAIDFVNKFAPEHLEIMTEVPEEVAKRINNSGLILIGDYTPVSSTDYCMGVNHVLPTGGYAKITSGITVLDYVKSVSIVKANKTSLGLIRSKVGAFTDGEGLPNHLKALEARFK